MPALANIFRVLLLIVCLVAAVLACFDWDTSDVANDGVQYLSTATNWINGDGFSTSTLIYTPHFQDQIPAAQTIWPPGYPFVIAIASLSGLDLQQSALAVNLLGHALAGVLVFLILRSLSVARGFAITSAYLFYLTAMSWHYTLGLVTEPIFTVLTLAIVLLLPKPDHSHWSRFLFCGLLAAATVYVRYSAILFAFSVGLVYLTNALSQSRLRASSLAFGLGKLLLIGLPPVLALLQLMFRNQQLTGNMQRETGFDSPDTIAATVKLWIGHSADVLGFSPGGIFSHGVGLMLFGALLLIVVVLSLYALSSIFSRSIKPSMNPVKGTDRLPRSVAITLSVILLHSLIFIAYLSYCNLTDSPLSITTRYLYQIYPGLFILFCYLLWVALSAARNKQRQGTRPGALRAYHAVYATLIGIFLLAQLNEALAPPRFTLKAKFVHSAMTLPVTNNMDLSTFIERCFADTENSIESTASIWSSHGQQLHLNTGVPTLTRTEIYASKELDFNALAEQIARYNVRLFVFFDEIEALSAEHVAAMHSIMEWLPENGHLPVLMQEIMSSHNIPVYVYTVDDQCRQHL